MTDYHIIGYRTKDGTFRPYGFCAGHVSARTFRQFARALCNESDYSSAAQLHWNRLYDSPQKMRAKLNRMTIDR